MFTIFSTPKAFRGEFAEIQLNAISSWMALDPRPTIILLGDEPGAAEISKELGLHHIPDVARNEFGTPLVSGLFRKAKENSDDRVLCYTNADMIYLSDFARAITAVSQSAIDFLMVGQRCTVKVPSRPDLGFPGWESDIRALAENSGKLDTEYFVDYFAFSRDLYPDIPPFAIGRPAYDNWLIWRAKKSRARVVDATQAVLAIHQEHGYSHVQQGRKGVYEGDEAARNLALAGPGRLLSIADATHVLMESGHVQPARGAKYRRAKRARVRLWLSQTSLAKRTKSFRHKVGLSWSTWNAIKRRLRSGGRGPQ